MAETPEQRARTKIDQLFEVADWQSLPSAMARIRIWRSAAFRSYSVTLNVPGPVTISTTQGHKIEYDELNASQSKPILNEIDCVLGRHYGFTEEELDWVINYDIKYRMGRDAESEESEE